MNDRQAFERVMELMCMKASDESTIDGGVLVEYQDTEEEQGTEKFTTMGYDSFLAGVIFDSEGNIVKGYLDSHVCSASKNYKEIEELKKEVLMV